mgnify:CR=1 FL=1
MGIPYHWYPTLLKLEIQPQQNQKAYTKPSRIEDKWKLNFGRNGANFSEFFKNIKISYSTIMQYVKPNSMVGIGILMLKLNGWRIEN